jgi:HK97 family phage portal protein
VIKRLFNSTTSLSAPAQWLIDWVRGPESDAGVPVTVDSALGYPPVWYAVSKISGHVGQLSLNLHRYIEPEGSEHAETHPVYRLMRTRPNPYQTAIAFKEQLMLHALLTGNGRAAILRRNGIPYELVPLLPNSTYTCLMEGEKWHVITTNGEDRLRSVESRWTRHEGVYKIKDEDVLHIPGLSYDGITGISLITVARETLGLGLASRKAGAKSFQQGGKPGVVIHAPPGAFRDDKDAKEFIDNFNNYHEGLNNTGKAALMREGMTLSTLAISASDNQWVEQRRFERQEAALLFLLEQILGDDSSVSYNSLEQKNLAYLSNCLMRWLVKWEQECDYKLLNDRTQRTHYFKFNTAALLRADYRTTIESLSMGITSRIINPNEAREKLDMNPYDGGDEFANPAITPGKPGAEEPKESESSQQMTVEDANRAAIVGRFRHLLGVSANNAKQAAKDPDKFLKYIDVCYDENGRWRSTISGAVSDFGGTDSIASEFVEELRNDLLEISGTVTQDGLSAAVAEVVSGWPERAERLADRIICEGLCNA